MSLHRCSNQGSQSMYS